MTQVLGMYRGMGRLQKILFWLALLELKICACSRSSVLSPCRGASSTPARSNQAGCSSSNRACPHPGLAPALKCKLWWNY